MSHKNRLIDPTQLVLRVPVPWVFVMAYLVGVGCERLYTFNLLSSESLATISVVVGIVLFAAGALFASWCLLIFHKVRTTTTPGETSRKLVTWGPYRLSRNPMYVSLTLAYVGEAGILKQMWPLFFLPLVLAYVQWTVIPLEETRLREALGQEYQQYAAHVRKWI